MKNKLILATLAALMVALLALSSCISQQNTSGAASNSIRLYADNQTEINSSQVPQLSLEGYIKVDTTAEPSVIYLSGQCYQMSMATSIEQTESISNGIDKMVNYRPNAHDLMKDSMEALGVEVLMVKIESFQDSTYYARVFLAQQNKIIGIDSRPSDAIALAVRADAPVYIRQELLKGQGEKVC